MLTGLCGVQMDAMNRSCVVSAHFGSHQVHLVVKFPDQYPNNAAPTFQFVSPTTISSTMKTKIQKVQPDVWRRTLQETLRADGFLVLLRSSGTRLCRR